VKGDISPVYARIRSERQKIGLAYGILAGLGFSLTTWGYDAFLLSRAYADLPWLKLAIGGVFCLAIGGFVGWMAGRLDSPLFAFPAWLLAGVSFAWFTSHLPFEILTKVIALIDPKFQGLVLYPYTTNVKLRMVIVYVVVTLMAGIAGGLQTLLVESARVAGTRLLRWLTLSAVLLLFAVGGTAADNINQPFRDPLLSVDHTIRFALSTEGTPVDTKLAADMHLRAIEPLKGLLHKPRRLILGEYEPVYLDSFSIYIDFDGTWAYCSVFVNQPGICQVSANTFPEKLGCLLDDRDPQSCQIGESEAARQWLSTWKDQLKQPVVMAVLDERGPATLMAVTDSANRQSICRFGGINYTVVLEECTAFQETKAVLASSPVSTWVSKPPGQITSGPALTETIGTSIFAPQDMALLPNQRPVLDTLPDLARYLISADVNFAEHRLEGHLRLEYTNTEDVPLDKLYFRLFPNGDGSYGQGSLTVSDVIKEGVPVLSSLSLDNSVLEVNLVSPLPVNAQTRIEMDFSAAIPAGSADTGYGIYGFRDNILTLANWYPILAVYDSNGWNLDPVYSIGDSVFSDMALYTVDIKLPSDLKLAATGVEVTRREAGGVTEVRYASGPVRDFFVAISPDFQVTSRVVDGTQVNSYYLPGRQAGGQQALETAASSLDVFNSHFGQYPYSELDIVGVPLVLASGVEYPGLILLGDGMYQDYTNVKFTTTDAHEVAHQWWYNVVGNNVIDDPWMDEALATYSSVLYWDFTQGSSAYQEAMSYYQGRYDQFLQNSPDDKITGSLAYFTSLPNPAAYSVIVYTKGALFFQALRDKIGDEAFFEALRYYYNTYQFMIATPQDLLGAFERTSGKKLGDFYNQWLYSTKP